MAKYHVNPNTGNAGLCKAQTSCPFGDDEVHGASPEAAYELYAKRVEKDSDPETNAFGTFKKSSNGTVEQVRDFDPLEDMWPNPSLMWDKALYSHEGLDVALEEADRYRDEGKFVVLMSTHEEMREEVDEPYEEDFEDPDEFEEASEAYYDLMDNREDEVPKTVHVTYQAEAFESRAAFESWVKSEDNHYNGSANNILSYEPTNDFDGYEAPFDNDTWNNWRGYRGYAQVYHDPEA